MLNGHLNSAVNMSQCHKDHNRGNLRILAKQTARQCQLCSNWEPSSGPFKFREIPSTTLVGQDQAGSNVYPNNLAAGLTSFGIWKDEKKIHLAAAALQGLNIGAVWRHRALPGLTSTIQCTLGFQMENFATSGAGDIRNIPNIHSIV